MSPVRSQELRLALLQPRHLAAQSRTIDPRITSGGKYGPTCSRSGSVGVSANALCGGNLMRAVSCRYGWSGFLVLGTINMAHGNRGGDGWLTYLGILLKERRRG